jgi:hypothetical protein
VKRIHKHREDIDVNRKREKSQPGSGNIWTNKVTKPQEFKLRTEGLNVNKSFNIKSLTKVIYFIINVTFYYD